MGTYGLEGVIRAWKLEQLTTEQAIGQILQLVAGIEDRLRDLEHKYSRMNRIASRSMRPAEFQDNEIEENED